MSFGGLAFFLFFFLFVEKRGMGGRVEDRVLSWSALFAFQRSSWLVTEAAGLGPSGHLRIWRHRFFFPRREGLGLTPPCLFLTGTLDRGGWD